MKLGSDLLSLLVQVSSQCACVALSAAFLFWASERCLRIDKLTVAVEVQWLVLPLYTSHAWSSWSSYIQSKEYLSTACWLSFSFLWSPFLYLYAPWFHWVHCSCFLGISWDEITKLSFPSAMLQSHPTFQGPCRFLSVKCDAFLNISQRDLHLPSFALLFDAISLDFTAPSLRIASQHCIFLEPLVSPEANRRYGQNTARSWEASCFSAMPMAESSPF